MRIRRRRSHPYTPEQETARARLHKAEAWLKVVSYGIAASLKRELYCTDGIRRIVEMVNAHLVLAVDQLDFAQQEHDLAFNRPGREADRIVPITPTSGANPKPRRENKTVRVTKKRPLQSKR